MRAIQWVPNLRSLFIRHPNWQVVLSFGLLGFEFADDSGAVCTHRLYYLALGLVAFEVFVWDHEAIERENALWDDIYDEDGYCEADWDGMYGGYEDRRCPSCHEWDCDGSCYQDDDDWYLMDEQAEQPAPPF